MAKYKIFIITLLLICFVSIAMADNHYEIIDNDFSNNECKDVKQMLKECSIYSCIKKEIFSNIYIDILGLDSKDRCQYIETTKNMGGMICHIPKDELVSFIHNNNDRNKYCSNKTRFDLLIKHHIAQNEEQIRETHNVYYNHQKENIISNIIKPAFSEKSIKSVMFFPEELEALYQNDTYHNQYMKGKFPVIYKFHLKAIRYSNNTDWIIWINNFKITNFHNTFLKIKQINHNNVTLTWRSTKLNMLQPNWKKYLYKIDQHKYINIDKTIVVEQKDGIYIISFQLSPNQVFNAKKLRIKNTPIIQEYYG